MKSIEIGDNLVGNWEFEPERLDVVDGMDITISVKDENDRVIDIDGELILEFCKI
ncbi:MAG: hypothetical protein PHI16_03130 [Methanocellales archaeon]|nr:hypothetical protein [Methanocellales archaeon]MDD4898141.1 hypothetical protein [Methanocellales archaeon]